MLWSTTADDASRALTAFNPVPESKCRLAVMLCQSKLSCTPGSPEGGVNENTNCSGTLIYLIDMEVVVAEFA